MVGQLHRTNQPRGWPNALALDAAGNVYVTGTAASGAPWDYDVISADYETFKYSANGERLWQARYNGPANLFDVAQALAVDASGNVYVTGVSDSGNGTTDYATVQYSPTGQQLWVVRYDGPANQADRAMALAVDAAGNVYVTGASVGSSGTSDFATIKYGKSVSEPPPACDRTVNQPVAAADRLSGARARGRLRRPGCWPTTGTPGPAAAGGQRGGAQRGLAGAQPRRQLHLHPWAGYVGPATFTYLVQEAGPVLASAVTGHYYEFVSAPGICWAEAQAAAAARRYQGMAGYLATITLESEKTFCWAGRRANTGSGRPMMKSKASGAGKPVRRQARCSGAAPPAALAQATATGNRASPTTTQTSGAARGGLRRALRQLGVVERPGELW
ncbi:hypothetical protein ACFQT0_30060 [Hymenobacter humi]|uniref:SMP-30/Gluconolactonase/LRE-like region domain-containing protein n=1 Tax=Hymenobacter humi TaxID=1411620 RepID=A0ABW2UC97_9BACT